MTCCCRKGYVRVVCFRDLLCVLFSYLSVDFEFWLSLVRGLVVLFAWICLHVICRWCLFDCFGLGCGFVVFCLVVLGDYLVLSAVWFGREFMFCILVSGCLSFVNYLVWLIIIGFCFKFLKCLVVDALRCRF